MSLWRMRKRMVLLAILTTSITLIALFGSSAKYMVPTSSASVRNHTAYRLPPLAEELANFAPRINETTREALIELIQRLTDVLDAFNVTHFICSGTLLGSYRHHGVIPWDDDVDICALPSDKKRIEDGFKRSKLSKDFVLYTKFAVWKMYSLKKGQTINSWKYPFIDIVFLEERKNGVSFVMDFMNPIQYSDIFPLHKRPFANLMLWAPCDVKTFLGHEFRGDLESMCVTNAYMHNVDRTVDRRHSVDCSRLWAYFPFVFKSNSSYTNDSSSHSVIITTVEQLKIGDNVIQTIEVKSSAPYSQFWE